MLKAILKNSKQSNFKNYFLKLGLSKSKVQKYNTMLLKEIKLLK